MTASVRPPIGDDMLEAAQRAFARHGIERSTLERISAEAGLSRVTLHRRGVTKGALIAALLERAVEQYRRAMWPILTEPGTNPERLERALGVLCDVAEDHLALLAASVMLRDAPSHERGRDGEVLTRAPFTDPLERLLRDGGEDGSLRTLDPRDGATTLVSLVGQTYLHLRSGHRWSSERARSATLDLALRGLLVRPSRAA